MYEQRQKLHKIFFLSLTPILLTKSEHHHHINFSTFNAFHLQLTVCKRFKCLSLVSLRIISLISPCAKFSSWTLHINQVFTTPRICLYLSNFNIWFINHKVTLHLPFLSVHLLTPGLGDSNFTASTETSWTLWQIDLLPGAL